MPSKGYLPKAHAALLSWLLNFMSYLTANLTRFGIPATKADALQVLVTQYQTAEVKATNPNAGKADRVDRNEKAETVSKATREFVNVNLRYNEAVTDEDRVNLGLTVPDTKPTPPREPQTQPEVSSIDSSVIMRVSLHYKDSGTTSRAKPDGIHGAEIRWAILETPPTTTADLTNSEFSTRSPHTFIFEENQRGRTVWFRLRWENMRAQKGPWSELYSAVIP